VISTHILEEVHAVCTRAIIIDHGKIVADGTPTELEARSRFHQAVSIRLTSDYDLAADLKDVADVDHVEQDSADSLHYTILAKDGKAIFPTVSELAQRKDWPVSEFHINKGQLEDVFRTVTQSAT
ncbi:MAG: ABC transporter ATP-binding protein, partial [Gammaproteobacteria bacterium]|nr:ABC transporter ATP-binding protein [Gammaproteobacteria bacterium]